MVCLFVISLTSFPCVQVYIDKTNVDDYLVDSITQPAYGPNAAEVYYRCVTFLSIPVYCLEGCLQPSRGLLAVVTKFRSTKCARKV